MQSVLDRPLSGEQLRQADGYCPRHHIVLLMEEYGNPDSAMLCRECETELAELREMEAYEQQLEHAQKAKDEELANQPYEPGEWEHYYSQEYIDLGR